MIDTLVWVQHRLDDLVSRRNLGWSDAEDAEYLDLCEAERWFLGRHRHAGANEVGEQASV